MTSFRSLSLASYPRRTKAIISIIALGLALTACNSSGNEEDNADALWSPFSSQSYWETSDGQILVELSGYERGHEPGKSADFTINIENRRDQEAELLVCAKLIDEHRIVQQLDMFSVTIDPADSKSTGFTASFDEDLDPRAYGLALVIGDMGAIVHTVRVGIPDDDAGPWLDAEELVCDS